MAVIGISLILASVVWVLVRPPSWAPSWIRQWSAAYSLPEGSGSDKVGRGLQDQSGAGAHDAHQNGGTAVRSEKKTADNGAKRDTLAMPPPPPPPSIQPPTIEEPAEQTTPKASAAQPSAPVPTFSLSNDDDITASRPTPPSSAAMPPPPVPGRMRQPPAPGRMPPPPTPPSSSSSSPRVPSLQQFPAANSAQRASGPVPNRGGSGGGLAPPPTHTSIPKKPSGRNKVTLAPGRSPLDWARISGPSADLRGVPSSTPYMRVAPSVLKKQNGRKGTDAWMALNGKVYNITPYAEYHPGGVGELMRGAGKDGTRLFGEIHPWVNYETMLSACLVGLLVDEPVNGNDESEMDKMD